MAFNPLWRQNRARPCPTWPSLRAGHGATPVAAPHPLAGFQAKDLDRVPALVAVDQELSTFTEAGREGVEQEQRGAVELGDGGVRGGHRPTAR